MKRLGLALMLLAVTSTANASGYCYIYPNFDGYTPMDLSVVQLQCWVMMQEGHWTCNAHLCTNDNNPDWAYRASPFECSGDSCHSDVLNASGGVVLSGDYSRDVDATYVDSVDYNGRAYTCRLEALGGGSFKPSMCVL